MSTQPAPVIRHFADRSEGLAHFVARAGEAPRLLAYDDLLGCPMDTALAVLEWTGAIGVLRDDDLLHAARLTAETSAAVIERREGTGREYYFLGPRLEGPLDAFEGLVVVDEPGVKIVAFAQRAHALAHFLRATSGAGAVFNFLSRRAPEVRYLRRWLPAILPELDRPEPMVAGWFTVTGGGVLFVEDDPVGPSYRYIEACVEG